MCSTLSVISTTNRVSDVRWVNGQQRWVEPAPSVQRIQLGTKDFVGWTETNIKLKSAQLSMLYLKF
jgi:hypothetical protein